MDNEKLLSSLSPELRSKAIECKSADELMKLANENNIELSDEQLDAISGGCNLCSINFKDIIKKPDNWR